jgi:outer membrane receptor protein involved in Fe transport
MAGAAMAAPEDPLAPVSGEIVVTAQKYNSTIQNTPISISAVSGAQLQERGITTIEDMAHEIPGISMRSAGPGQTEYEARGLASNAGAAPTVGFYLDEVPLSPPATAQVGRVVIDPDLYDINRIEVLRGPQGTLYGSGSMGGTVKVVTNQPELGKFDGSLQGTVSGTQKAGGPNGGGNVAINIPIGDKVALRVVGSDSYRSGWIDRVVLQDFPQDTDAGRGDVAHSPIRTVHRDVNTVALQGARASLLVKPNDNLTIVGTALYQHMHQGGYDEFDSPPGKSYLAHYEAADIKEPIKDSVQVYSLTVTQNLGIADLTSATGYYKRNEDQTQDASESVSYFADIYPYVGIPYSEDDTTRQFSEELRLTSRGSDKLHWVVGGFYSDLHSTWAEFSANPAFADFTPGENPAGIAFASHNPYRIRQEAAFADGSYKITDTLKASAGVRYFQYQSRQLANAWGFYAPSIAPQPYSKTTSKDSGFNPRFNLSWSPNRDLTTYISAAEGFRPGGANQQIPAFCGAGQDSYGPDKVWNYELGEKAKLLNGRVTVNADVFYIKWRGVQETEFLPCGFGYTTNAGNARSFGPELEINARLDDHWSIALSAAYTDAKINAPSASLASANVGSVSGCNSISDCSLPILNVPKETASGSVTYRTTFSTDYRFIARVSANYIGHSYDQAYVVTPLKSYTMANARITIEHDAWSVSAFMNNITNVTTELTANNTEFQFTIPQLTRFSTSQPRTMGMEIAYKF